MNVQAYMALEPVALIVRDYDPAIRFFVDVPGFGLVEDTPSLTNDGLMAGWPFSWTWKATAGICRDRPSCDSARMG